MDFCWLWLDVKLIVNLHFASTRQAEGGEEDVERFFAVREKIGIFEADFTPPVWRLLWDIFSKNRKVTSIFSTYYLITDVWQFHKISIAKGPKTSQNSKLSPNRHNWYMVGEKNVTLQPYIKFLFIHILGWNTRLYLESNSLLQELSTCRKLINMTKFSWGDDFPTRSSPTRLTGSQLDRSILNCY